MLDPFPDAVDLVVGLEAVCRPFGIKLELLALIFERRGRDEVGTRDRVSTMSLVIPSSVELAMPGGFPIVGGSEWDSQ